MGSQFLVPLDHYVNFRLARCFGSLNRETYRRAPWLVRESLAHQYRISTSGSSCLPKDAHIMNDCLFSLATLDGNRSSHALRHFNSRVGNGAGTLMFRLPGESPGEPITSLSLGCSSNSWQSQSEEEPVRYAKALSTMSHDVRSSVATSSIASLASSLRPPHTRTPASLARSASKASQSLRPLPLGLRPLRPLHCVPPGRGSGASASVPFTVGSSRVAFCHKTFKRSCCRLVKPF